MLPMNVARAGLRACGLLLLALIAVNSAALLIGRTFVPMSSSPGLLPSVFRYDGRRAEGLSTLDPWATTHGAFASDLYMARAMREGGLPLWNPYQGLGQPFVGNGL